MLQSRIPASSILEDNIFCQILHLEKIMIVVGVGEGSPELRGKDAHRNDCKAESNTELDLYFRSVQCCLLIKHYKELKL